MEIIKHDLNINIYGFFETIFHTATESWILCDRKGNIKMVNPVTLKMFGYKEEEILEKKIETLMPKKERKEHVTLRKGYVDAPRKRPHGIGVEVFGLRKSGKEFPVEISLNYYEFKEELYVLAVVIDITKRKQKEKELHEAEIEKEKLKNEKLEYELKALKNQVSPHYFFNSLSVLTPLIIYDQEKSKAFTEKLANTYRYILEIRDRLTVTVSEELEFIKDYEFLQAVRFDNKFIIDYKVDEEGKKKHVLPFSIQVLIENAFKHNALYEDNKLNISIESDKKGIYVRNNIITKMDSKIQSLGVGLKNIDSQYSSLADLEISYSKQGDIFTAFIPYID